MSETLRDENGRPSVHALLSSARLAFLLCASAFNGYPASQLDPPFFDVISITPGGFPGVTGGLRLRPGLCQMESDMDTEAFIHWALDDSRTVEERYTVELLVEQGVDWWNSQRKIYRTRTIDESIARERERKLNPAYEPHYSETSLRKAVECLAVAKSWWFHSDRPIRDISALGFMTALEDVSLAGCFAGTDISPLTRLPALRKFSMGSPGYDFGNPTCRDFTPLARCTALRHLSIGFNVHWPDFTGIEKLTWLETLTLGGNLLAMPRGLCFPNVRSATLHCVPLTARNVADLPQLPACDFLTLRGAERLDGIEKMPALRNLSLLGPFESFEPLTALRELTCLTVIATDHRDPPKMPRDVAPLTRLPKLRFLQFGDDRGNHADLPRDYSPLTEAPALRELVVTGCPPVEMEVAAIQAGLPPCDDLWLLPEPRPLPPLRMVTAPVIKQPRRGDSLGYEWYLPPGEPAPADIGLREREARWVGAWLQHHIAMRLKNPDWGEASAEGKRRILFLHLHSFDCVGKFPIFIEAIREGMARLRNDWQHASFGIHLRVPPPEDTPAQKELLEKFRRDQDEWDFEQRQREQAEYLERLHRMELKKQEGAPIEPAEFSPSERDPDPEPPWEKETEDDEDESDSEGGIATKEKPAPPSEWLDDTHPLYKQYLCAGTLLPGEVWFYAHFRDLAVHLMDREPDEEIPEDPKPPET